MGLRHMRCRGVRKKGSALPSFAAPPAADASRMAMGKGRPGFPVAYQHYDRLTALDSMFLDLEGPQVHMHVGAVALFEAAPLTNADGELEIDRIRSTIQVALANSRRFRQKLVRIPLFDHPVWVDDDRFNLSYHVRHASLPKPGDIRLLKRLAGRILSQKLDLGKPLWEMWVIEGVEDDRFAIIAKAHHCMVDGISGLDLLSGMMRPDPDPSQEPADAWFPRPAPSRARLVRDELRYRASWPLSAIRSAGSFLTRPREVLAGVEDVAVGFGQVLRAGLRPTVSNPLNPDIGPHRRFDWAEFELAAVKEVKTRLGGTVNDAVLATAAGAIGRFLRKRGTPVNGEAFRAQIPVSLRGRSDRDDAGNRIVMLLADLPIHEPDPRRRLNQVLETTRRLKHSRQRAGVEFFENMSDHTLTSLFLFFARLATWQRSFNVVITNVPGPQFPLYLLGARMQEIYPLVPLAANQALGLALFSYDGRLYWGFNADWDALPDLHELVQGLELEFERLRKAALEP
jgi:diacylglycerol O-acyltransferase